jgi:hypothetical protein
LKLEPPMWTLMIDIVVENVKSKEETKRRG